MLSCGHEPTWTPSDPHACGTKKRGANDFTTGSCTLGDGVSQICHPCAELREATQLHNRDHYMAYMDGSGKYITTWTGGILATIQELRETRAGFGGSRHYFRAIDTQGQLWYGNGGGPNMYCRMHRAK